MPLFNRHLVSLSFDQLLSLLGVAAIRRSTRWNKNHFPIPPFEANKIITARRILTSLTDNRKKKNSDWKRSEQELSPIIHRHFVSIEEIFAENENCLAGVGFSIDPTVQQIILIA